MRIPGEKNVTNPDMASGSPGGNDTTADNPVAALEAAVAELALLDENTAEYVLRVGPVAKEHEVSRTDLKRLVREQRRLNLGGASHEPQ
jgi:hypothetical protein